MNKDALLATAIGFIIGLCITGLLLVGPSIVKKMPKIALSIPKIEKKTTPTPKKSVTGEKLQFAVDSPIDGSIEDSDELLVSGTSYPGSLVVVQSGSSENVTKAEDNGTFASKINIEEGANDITVTTYTDGNPETKLLRVYYTPESL